MDFKNEFFKYFVHWKWFALSLILCLGIAFYFLKTIPPTYETSALLFIDKKQDEKTKIISTSSNTTNESTKEENLVEEVRLVTSNDFLMKVVRSTNLNISYFEEVYKIQGKYVSEVPFIVIPTVGNDVLPQSSYKVKIDHKGFTLTDVESEKSYVVIGYNGTQILDGLPFKIKLSPKALKNPSIFFDADYVVNLEPDEVALNNLKQALVVMTDEGSIGSLELNHTGTSPYRSRKILDDIIVLLDKNIVINKQKLYVNTVSYLNQRIKSFTKEKDSIESVKEKFLQNNDILVMENFITEKTADRSVKNENSAVNERQIELTNYAINDIRASNGTRPLGTDYKLEAPSVNQMLVNYNTKLMESELILQRAQKNNPTYVSLMTQLKSQRQEILNTLESYLSSLKQTSRANRAEQSIANSKAKSIPTNDKILGNINSNLNTKESTYVALLQKREEAILNGAIIESNLKTLNSPETNYSPIFPQPRSFMLGAFLLGLLIPFGAIYITLQLDSKIHNEEDIHKINATIPFLGYIPRISSKDKLDNTANSRSLIAEATRTLVSNINYLLPGLSDSKGKVILVTSSIQGEGKSFCAFHNAVTLSNLNKKVLLIGADLRNPQLHDYFNLNKNELGLVNYLFDKKIDWKSSLRKGTEFSSTLDILIAGEIPPNPTQLLTNSNLETLIEEAKNLYDYIILDTAPVQMISDTLNFSHLADVTVYVTKFNYTDKSAVVQFNKFNKKEQLKNVGFVINQVNMKSAYGYGYNYGYQYEEKIKKKPWYKKSNA
jgi:capsular exopolysaccharide synthesis family protein